MSKHFDGWPINNWLFEHGKSLERLQVSRFRGSTTIVVSEMLTRLISATNRGGWRRRTLLRHVQAYIPTLRSNVPEKTCTGWNGNRWVNFGRVYSTRLKSEKGLYKQETKIHPPCDIHFSYPVTFSITWLEMISYASRFTKNNFYTSGNKHAGVNVYLIDMSDFAIYLPSFPIYVSFVFTLHWGGLPCRSK